MILYLPPLIWFAFHCEFVVHINLLFCSQAFTNRPQAVFGFSPMSLLCFRANSSIFAHSVVWFFINRFIIRQYSSEYAKALIFCEKHPLLHTNFESYAKVLRFEKPTGFAGRRFRAFQRPKIIPLYPALKSTAWNPLQNPLKSHQFSFQFSKSKPFIFFADKP